jgi:hypothetical protein
MLRVCKKGAGRQLRQSAAEPHSKISWSLFSAGLYAKTAASDRRADGEMNYLVPRRHINLCRDTEWPAFS